MEKFIYFLTLTSTGSVSVSGEFFFKRVCSSFSEVTGGG